MIDSDKTRECQITIACEHGETSTGIDLTKKEFELLRDIEHSFTQQKARNWLRIRTKSKLGKEN